MRIKNLVNLLMKDIYFLKTLRKGVNPVTAVILSEDDPLRQPEVLQRIDDLIADLKQKEKENWVNFDYDPSMAAKIKVVSKTINLTTLSKHIADVVDDSYKKIFNAIRAYLAGYGFLVDIDGTKDYITTDLAKEYGMSTKFYSDERGHSHTIMFNENAQRMIIDMLPAIAKFKIGDIEN